MAEPHSTVKLPDVENLSIRSCESGPPPWEYVCHQCEALFELPAPRGPTEEKEARCLECGSKDIERLNVYNWEAQPCPG